MAALCRLRKKCGCRFSPLRSSRAPRRRALQNRAAWRLPSSRPDPTFSWGAGGENGWITTMGVRRLWVLGAACGLAIVGLAVAIRAEDDRLIATVGKPAIVTATPAGAAQDSSGSAP